MKGWNAILGMTEKERREKLYGKPKASAKIVGNGFDRHWEYRGVRMHRRKDSGWNTGQIWWSDPINGQQYETRNKDVLMTKIDRALDGQASQS